jgi:hypothetical protein
MTMKEACEYVANQKKANAIHRNSVVKQGGSCSGITDKQYKSIKVKSKGAGSKGRNHSHTKLWNHYNEPIEKFAN